MAKNEESDKKQRITTPKFRVAFPHVFKASAMKGAAPKYSVTMLFSKTDDLSVVKLAMKHAKIAKFGPDKANWPDDLESPVLDGDSPKYAKYEGYKGHWAIKASSIEEAKPGIVDKDCEPIVDQSEFYPGCFARAQVFARVWEFGGKQGVHFILDHVQKWADGKPFGGKGSASDAFSPLTNDDAEDIEETADSDSF